MDKEILELLKNITGRFDSLEKRFDNLESRFDNLENKVDKLDSRLDKVDIRLENLENGQKQLKDKLDDMSKDMIIELSNIASKVSGVDEIAAKNAHNIVDLDMEVTKLKAKH